MPLTARLLWLGLRADADARSLAEIQDDAARLRELVSDGEGLRDRAVGLSTGDLSDGVRRQLGLYLELIEGEISRLSGSTRSCLLGAGRGHGPRPVPEGVRPVAPGRCAA